MRGRIYVRRRRTIVGGSRDILPQKKTSKYVISSVLRDNHGHLVLLKQPQFLLFLNYTFKGSTKIEMNFEKETNIFALFICIKIFIECHRKRYQQAAFYVVVVQQIVGL